MESRNTHALKQLSLFAAAAVYAGAVIYGDIMFLTVMASAFPDGILGALAMAGAVMTAASALILPLALHFWFAPGTQFIAGILFWVVDIVVLALNSMLAYAIATNSGMLATWAEFAPATPLLAVFGWGVMFLLDPSHKLRHAQIELEADLIDIHTEQLRIAAKDAAVSNTISAGAKARASEMAALITGIRVKDIKTTSKLPAQVDELPVLLASSTGNHTEPEVLANPTLRRRSKS